MNREEHLEAEAQLLDFGIRWYANKGTVGSNADVSWKATDVPVPPFSGRGTQDFIHTIEYTGGLEQPNVPPLVLIHGYGFGAALYYASAPALAQEWPGRIFSLDEPGCGLSSRPPWPHPHGHWCPLERAEAYFVDAIETWREALGLETMVLVGHSIGGYIAAAYAERHPERIARLILASPAGVPTPPAGLAEAQAKAPVLLKVVRSLFARGWSPFLISKNFGIGRRALTGYMAKRHHDHDWIPKPLLISYLTGIWCRSPYGAGGHMMQALVTLAGAIPAGTQGEFVYARAPLADRLIPLAKIVPRVSLIYGEFDWMFWRNGADVRARQEPGAEAPIDVLRVAQASHQQMIDNPMGFVDAVLATGLGTATDAIPIGAGFGQHYGAKAKIFERAAGEELPQDKDFITLWASEDFDRMLRKRL